MHFCLQVNLVDWLKSMVGNRKAEQVVDPKMPEMPASKALKRILLVALRCVDPDATKRPKMGHVIHMLEADELLIRDVCHTDAKTVVRLILDNQVLILYLFLFLICRSAALRKIVSSQIAIISQRILVLRR